MRAEPGLAPSSRTLGIDRVVLLGICLAIATGVLVYHGYHATQEWQRSARVSVERRAVEVLTLLATALDRDMKGAQVSVLLPLAQQALVMDPYDLADRFARGFARFPYPESFFAWRDAAGRRDELYFFNRADRLAPWDVAHRTPSPYPVVIIRDAAPGPALIAEALRHMTTGMPLGVFETSIVGEPYQVVVHYIHDPEHVADAKARRPLGLLGFTVNLNWVRREYFNELIRQVRSVGEFDGSIALRILEESGQIVATGPSTPDAAQPLRARAFPLLFFDRTLLSSIDNHRVPVRYWKAVVNTATDSAGLAAQQSAERSFAIMSLAAAVTIAALIVIVRAVRVSTQLAVMKSEFVSSVTHELKTPLALIRLVAETLEKRRYTKPEFIADYARLLSQESTRLTRLIDNLLMYARVNDAPGLYSFEPLELVELVDEAVDHFHAQLVELGFDVSVDIPIGLPRIRADRATIRQVIENLIDNAIKYSEKHRAIAVRAAAVGARIRLEVEDRGSGIPSDEVPHVFDKFFRGRSAGHNGSGFGLAIARRIAHDHGGDITILSAVGQGTVVALELPVSEAG